jgi:hypothetical protein
MRRLINVLQPYGPSWPVTGIALPFLPSWWKGKDLDGSGRDVFDHIIHQDRLRKTTGNPIGVAGNTT